MNVQILDFLRQNALFLAMIVVLVGAFIFLRTKGANLGSVSEFDALIRSGRPVVVEFYSNT
jgi:hypothetical protein